MCDHSPVSRVALLHGFAGDPAAWDATIDAWRGPAEPVAIALPGHGRGPVRDGWHANLAAIDLAGSELAVGYSLGARVALGLLATGRIRHAVLIGVNPGLPAAERPARRAADAVWATLLRDRGIVAFVDAWQAQPLFASQARVDPTRLATRRARRLALDPEQLARSLETMGLAEMPDLRDAIDDRCRLIAGDGDTRFVGIARGLPAPLELIADCGHDAPLEQPARLAAAIERAVVDLESTRDLK